MSKIKISFKIIKRNQRKILDLKSTSKLKNSLEKFNIDLNRQKKKIRNLRMVFEEQEAKKNEVSKRKRDLWSIKWNNVYIIGVPEKDGGREREQERNKGTENI